mmetsp:Transcript_4797/g.14760  ORF Transcript_4797/g.14760 Transcript_4797/m.14760 type:complete len:252 (-) Transcript_4797:189-944(-)
MIAVLHHEALGAALGVLNLFGRDVDHPEADGGGEVFSRTVPVDAWREDVVWVPLLPPGLGLRLVTRGALDDAHQHLLDELLECAARHDEAVPRYHSTLKILVFEVRERSPHEVRLVWVKALLLNVPPDVRHKKERVVVCFDEPFRDARPAASALLERRGDVEIVHLQVELPHLAPQIALAPACRVVARAVAPPARDVDCDDARLTEREERQVAVRVCDLVWLAGDKALRRPRGAVGVVRDEEGRLVALAHP